MIRILIFIFALNAFFTSASAKSLCFMPMESDSAVMIQEASDHCAKMGEETQTSCCSASCSFDCSYHFSPFSVSKESPMPIIGLSGQPQIVSPHFYQIILPVITPPPLV